MKEEFNGKLALTGCHYSEYSLILLQNIILSPSHGVMVMSIILSVKIKSGSYDNHFELTDDEGIQFVIKS